jgi:predicted PurR-regulated permease PerM
MATLATREAIRLVFVTLILLGLTVYLFDVLLLFFAAALLAVVFRAPSEWLARHTHIDVRITLGFVLLVLAGLLTLAGWLVGHSMVEELEGVWRRLPEAIEELRGRTRDIAVVGPAVENAAREGSAPGAVKSGLTIIAAALGVLTNFALVLFVAVLVAAQPEIYVRGALHLLPKRHRKRTEQVLDEVGHVLRRWMLGQLILMTLVGTLTYVGFRIIGVEYAGALGLLAGALTFIPYLGSLAAGAVAVLVALAQGADVALYAAAVYGGVQIIENVCEPFVQQRAVYLAPALLLFSQAVLGALAGPLGIVLATPLAAVVIVAVKMLYVEDALGDHSVQTGP